MSTVPWTVSRYFARKLIYAILIVGMALSVLALLIDTLELLRRASSRDHVGIPEVALLAFTHLPFLMQKMFPFMVLFGTIFCFQQLNRTQEVVAGRALGLSVWWLIAPALCVCALMGVLIVSVFNPLSAWSFDVFQRYEHQYMNSRADLIEVSGGELWMRQEGDDGHEIIITAATIQRDPILLRDVTLLTFTDSVRFDSRIDAEDMLLEDGHWFVSNGQIISREGNIERFEELRLPTDFTTDSIQESFASPEEIAVWKLPEFIRLLESLGFSTLAHRLHFHSLLALPATLCAMTLIGLAFSLRMNHRSGSGVKLLGALVTGFAFYILSDVIFAVGLSGRLPAILAAWSPAVLALLMGSAALFYLEDG